MADDVFDLIDSQSVLLALMPIAGVPVEAFRRDTHKR